MFTVTPPRKKNLASSLDSDRRNMIALQPDGRLLTIAASINAARQEGTAADMQRACTEFLRTAYDFYEVPECSVRVLAARPLRVREYSTTELFGDYHPDTRVIRVWQRTAIRKEITSFGTFLSTLCLNSVTTWISTGLDSAIPGTRVDSMNGLRCSTTTREAQCRRSWCGFPFAADAAALTGSGQIEVAEGR